MSAISLNSETVDHLREPAFMALLLIGATVFALSAAFLVVGIAINTAPPAPWVTQTDKYLLIGLSITGMVVGTGLVRLAGRMVGW